MKRSLILGAILAVLGGGVFAYFQYGGSPEVRRDRYLTKAREYVKHSRFREAILEARNAVKAEPRSAEARMELSRVLTLGGDFRGAYGELVRVVDLHPDLIKARYELALMELLSNNINKAKDHLEKLRTQDRNGFPTRYLAAKIFLAEKAPEKAIEMLKEILKSQPDSARIYIDIATIENSRRNFSSAEEAFRKALELDPKASSARVGLAQVYLATGDPAKGEEQLILATKAEPENEILLHVLGIYYSVNRKFDDVERVYLDLLKKKPDSLIAKKRLAELNLAKGMFDRSRQLVEEILKAGPNDVDGHFFRGRLNLIENAPQKAVEDLTLVSQKRPQFAPGFYFLGLAQAKVGQINPARKSLLKASELSPNWTLPRLALGELFVSTNEPALAMEQIEQILREQPKNEAALFIAGSALIRKNELEKALTLFKRAQVINPNSVSVRVNIAGVYVLQKKLLLAFKEYEEILRLNPERLDALQSLAQIEVLRGNAKEAFGIVEKHLSKTNNRAGVYQLLGRMKLDAKDYPKAIEYLEKAIAANPNLTSPYLMIANAYSAQGKNDAAISQYEKTIATKPKEALPLMMIGILYDRKKQPEKANEYYKKALEINKNFSLAANNLAWNYMEFGGNLDVALALAQKARELDPHEPVFADTLGWINYKKRAYLNALSLLKESNEKLKSSNPEVLYHLGMAYMKNGDKTLAMETLGKALASEKSFAGLEEAKKALEELKPRSK